MQLPTNYKMGTGLAGAIMGGQAGLEQEKLGLENLYKGMQMPGEILKGEEQAMLLQDPRYLQQKTANTMIELGNQFDANQFQQSLNAFGRFKLQLQAAGGDPEKTQQIVLGGLQQMNIGPDNPFYDYALKNPDKAIDQLIEGTKAAAVNASGAKHLGAEKLQGMQDTAAMARTQAQIQGHHEDTRTSAGATLAAARLRSSNEKINEQAADAMRIARDPNATPAARQQAQQFLDDLIVYNQSKSAGFAGSAYSDGKFQPKAETAPRFKWGDQESKPVVVTAPNGKSYTFKTQAEADAFKQKAGIKD